MDVETIKAIEKELTDSGEEVNQCPICKTDDFEYHLESETPPYGKASCNVCGATWLEVFKFDCIEMLETK